MDFLEKIPSKRPLQIDIYVDGSWLQRTESNAKTAGGWGAVVIETYKNHQDKWYKSGPAESGHFPSEVFAILHGLRAVQEHESHRSGDDPARTKIIAHTDQARLVKDVTRAREQGIAISGKQQADNLPLKKALEELVGLVNAMDATAEFSSANKSIEQYNPLMVDAHVLATQAAWLNRIIKQKGTVSYRGHAYHLTKPEETQDFLTRLQPKGKEPGRGR